MCLSFWYKSLTLCMSLSSSMSLILLIRSISGCILFQNCIAYDSYKRVALALCLVLGNLNMHLGFVHSVLKKGWTDWHLAQVFRSLAIICNSVFSKHFSHRFFELTGNRSEAYWTRYGLRRLYCSLMGSLAFGRLSYWVQHWKQNSGNSLVSRLLHVMQTPCIEINSSSFLLRRERGKWVYLTICASIWSKIWLPSYVTFSSRSPLGGNWESSSLANSCGLILI